MSNHKVSKPVMTALLLVFVWVVLCNLIVQMFHLHPSWPLFLSSALVFLLPETNLRKKLPMIFIGAAVGLVMAWVFVMVYGLLAIAGLPDLAAIMIPLTGMLALLILLHPILPRVFNNVGFIYFIVALIDAEQVLVETIPNLVSLIVGGVIINAGSLLIVHAVTAHYTKKAMAAKS